MQEVALSLPEAISFPEWVGVGRELADKKKNIDWLIGDWIGYGRTNYPQQIDLALGDMALDVKHLRQIERTVKAFPPHLRDASLSFDHHATLSTLPIQHALPLLKEAGQERLSASALRTRAEIYKVGAGLVLPDDDPDEKYFKAMQHAWNMAPPDQREYFLPLAIDANYGMIDG